MGSGEVFYSYKETRVSLEPSSPATVVHARLPAVSGGRRLTSRIGGGSGGTRGDYHGRNGHGGSPGSGGGGGGNGGGSFGDTFSEEERSYRVRNLASEASIFQRKHHNTSRSFLWRVLERGDVLSIRAVDIGKPDPAALDAPLTLYLHFPKPIRPGCVAFADPPHHDALTVFVLDESFHLHHLQLRPDVFRKRTFTNEADLGEAWKPYLSTTFNFKQPRRLVAVSANEFIVTLHDGGLINFRREHAHEEAFHSPVGLIQGLRSILPFQGGPTIKYEGTNLEIAAAASAVVTTMGLDDTSFLFSVCLDHRLRVWNVGRGEVCYTNDILGLPRDQHEVGKWTIDPSQSNLIRILELGEGVSVVVVYSPVGAGAFKFWRATATPDGRIDIEPFGSAEEPLTPPTPSSSDVWTLADFAVVRPEPHKVSLWVLWKNNLVYRVMKMECAPDNLAAHWNQDWLGVHADNGAPTAQTSGPCDPIDAAEKWLDIIFFPGRFARATLETALAMYERGLGTATTKDGAAKSGGNDGYAAGGKSLMESICLALGSTAALERNSSGAPDYELFRSTSEIQWRRFYRLLVELDKQRSEALSLVLDPDFGLAWVVCADSVVAIRECSELERIFHNAPAKIQNPAYGKVSRLLTAGATFVNGFSDGMLQTSEAALRAELFEESSKTDEERIQSFTDKAGFWRYLTEDECAPVVDILGENFGDVVEASYEALFALLGDVQSHDVRYPFTQFGQKLVIRGIQDTAELFWQILFRQLILLVHMESEIEDDKHALRARLDVGHVYVRLIEALKRLELVKWLSKNEFSVALSRSERESLSLPGSFSGGSFSASGSVSGSPVSARRTASTTGGGGSGGSPDENPSQTVTVLEGSVGHLLGFGEFPSGGGVPLASLLTDIIVDVCSARGSIELNPAMIQCMLLKRARPDLSLQLSPFADDDPFSTYVQGRTFFALRDYDTASSYFQKAALGLSVHLRSFGRHSAGLLDDAEWNLFYSGLPNYYAHIVSLFDRQKAYSFVVDFARLSLQFIHSKGIYGGGSSFENAKSRNTGHNGSQASNGGAGGSDQAEAAALADTRTEMLSRLFTAATALSRYDVAHGALLSMGHASRPAGAGVGAGALQRSGLKHLVEKMCESGQVAALLVLPFPGALRDAVDDLLESKCRAAMEVVRGTPWHQILYAWRIAHNDYRGAASALLDRLHKLQQAGEGDKFLASAPAPSSVLAEPTAAAGEANGDDVLDTPVTRQYLMLINTLSCVDPKQAWIYIEDPSLSLSLTSPASAPASLRAGKGNVHGGKAGSGGIPSGTTQDEKEAGDAAAAAAVASNENVLSASQETEVAEDSPSSSSLPSLLQARSANNSQVQPASSGASNGSDAMSALLTKAAATSKRVPWRKVITLADLRKQYQDELDRIAAIQNNQFAFGDAEDEDIIMDDS
ncbi:Nucleoporin Nup120/160 [Niveomyces insectorum RCEF 264]|uniref:Nucleoporin Nup120/160 n=1 Tax=Niveomyces insectorum RCEF 264 TaxID=1081102 RepID=A0A167PEW8_9HYPO|nr:Nucleoporin Nup120/160 [Niveomyces insectorum RCEF 264]